MFEKDENEMNKWPGIAHFFKKKLMYGLQRIRTQLISFASNCFTIETGVIDIAIVVDGRTEFLAVPARERFSMSILRTLTFARLGS